MATTHGEAVAMHHPPPSTSVPCGKSLTTILEDTSEGNILRKTLRNKVKEKKVKQRGEAETAADLYSLLEDRELPGTDAASAELRESAD